jgi:hypothetical protein
MCGDATADSKATALAGMVKAARPDFARQFDIEAALHDSETPVRLMSLVAHARLGAAPEADASSDAFAYRVAFRFAAAGGWLNALFARLAAAGLIDVDANNPEARAEVASHAESSGMTFEPQSVVSMEDGFPDLGSVMREFGLASRRVCEVMVTDVNGALLSKGTGFLVGPECVLTNWHVVRPLLSPETPRPDNLGDRLFVRFDRVMDDYAAPSGKPGVTLRARKIDLCDPCYDAEYNGADIDDGASPYASEEEKLDFALIRLWDAPGYERGWYKLQADMWPVPTSKLFLLQFPLENMMRITVGEIEVLLDETTRRRLRHRANSERGSSGGLCLLFNRLSGRLQPLAMHQAGLKRGWGQDAVNQAIPLAKIAPKVAQLVERVDRGPLIHILQLRSGVELMGAPVFGRSEFQHYVLDAMTNGVPRIIIVRAASAVQGKSFSEKILRSLLTSGRDVVVSIPAGGAPSTAVDFARRVLAEIEPPGGLDLPREENADTTDVAWIADRLVRESFAPRLQAAAGARLVWLVIDDLDRNDLPDAGGRRFLDALYQGVEAMPCLRIVLIGLKNDLASIAPGQCQIDVLERQPAIEEVKAWLVRRFGRGRKVDQDIVAALAKIACSVGEVEGTGAQALAAAVRAHFDRALPVEQS